ncbi:MAG: hypothetical protein ONB46_05430 [candidate division KSB1 bacterium]|nr:hypothetical protein [candidate division KSB1 bacterium]MDZ7365452.1 hypothetical protein [candidate division KSB1 bacterium]MDZ7403501.1 hypothetical protein [candidate division KSB1 bacterium]
MSRFRQHLSRLGWLWMLSALPLQAQIDSAATAHNIPALERIAILTFSGDEGLREQSENLAQALRAMCRNEGRFTVASEISLATYWKKHRNFSLFAAEDVQALCKNLTLNYLIAVTLDRATSSTPSSSPRLWQVTLRWFDGHSGQMTKIHTAEYHGDINTPASFPLPELWSSLLESPDIIVPLENQLPALAALTPTPGEAIVDRAANHQTTATLPRQMQNQRGRSWLWYLTGAALISGASAAALLKSSSKNPVEKKLLPEPPDPPN